MNDETQQLVRDLAIVALAAQVYTPAIRGALRRAAAAGVRTGVSEMQRDHTGEDPDGR